MKKTSYLIYTLKNQYLKNKNYPKAAFIFGLTEKKEKEIMSFFRRNCPKYQLEHNSSDYGCSGTRSRPSFIKMCYLYDNSSILANMKNYKNYSANLFYDYIDEVEGQLSETQFLTQYKTCKNNYLYRFQLVKVNLR